jgi:hypothetical protein
MAGIHSEKCILKQFLPHLHIVVTYTNADGIAIGCMGSFVAPRLLLSYKTVQHVTVQNAAGNYNTISIFASKYTNI